MRNLESLDILEDEEEITLDELDLDYETLDDLGGATGLTYSDEEELQLVMKELERDRHRWELDPASAEDWGDRGRW